MIRFLRSISLSVWILVATALGFLFGLFLPEQARHLHIIYTIFLHLIQCLIVPLVFATLVVGIAGHADDVKAVGRLALKSIIYFEIVTTAALFIGLTAVNLVRPGEGVHVAAAPAAQANAPVAKVSLAGVIEHLSPHSFFDSAARNDVLQVVVFAIIFGLAVGQVKGKPRQTMMDFFEGLSETMFKFTSIVMWFAPLGAGAAIAYTVAENGIGTLKSLIALVATLYGALIVFVLFVFVPVMLIARIPILRFFKTIREPAILAFSTASSEAALPDAMRLMEKFGVPRRIVSFVLPAGYSFNLDGSTLHLSLASIFVAQLAGLHLTIAQQIPIMLTLMLTSKGVAAVPRASTGILVATLTTFNIPVEGVLILLGVDAFLDMARTTVNLVGNCLASAVMARWEGELKLEPAAKSEAT